MVTMDNGTRKYELVKGWGQLPAGMNWGISAAVTIDSQDNVHVFTRTDHPYMVFDKSGKLLEHWGRGIFKSAHGLCMGPDDSVYCVDVEAHQVLKFDKNGHHRLTLGSRDEPSATGWTEESPTVKQAAGPFHRPTDLSLSPAGEMFVADGYRNARVHKFAPDGTLIKSWGNPGDPAKLKNTKDGPGLFSLVHGIWVHKGRVYVGDRDNDRVQIFDLDGNHIETWTDLGSPTKIWIDKDDVVYVTELQDRVSMLDLAGNVLGRIGERNDRSHDPGKFWGPHGIWGDSNGDLYVSEVLDGARVQKFARVK